MRNIKLLWFFCCFNKNITKRITFTKEEKCNIRRFSKFLPSHNAFNEFFLNFNDYFKNYGQCTISSTLRPWSYIQCAFSWMDTPERALFWKFLNEKWHNEIRL